MKDIRFVDAVDDEHLLRVEWAVYYIDVLSVLTETGTEGAVTDTQQEANTGTDVVSASI